MAQVRNLALQGQAVAAIKAVAASKAPAKKEAVPKKKIKVAGLREELATASEAVIGNY